MSRVCVDARFDVLLPDALNIIPFSRPGLMTDEKCSLPHGVIIIAPREDSHHESSARVA